MSTSFYQDCSIPHWTGSVDWLHHNHPRHTANLNTTTVVAVVEQQQQRQQQQQQSATNSIAAYSDK